MNHNLIYRFAFLMVFSCLLALTALASNPNDVLISNNVINDEIKRIKDDNNSEIEIDSAVPDDKITIFALNMHGQKLVGINVINPVLVGSLGLGSTNAIEVTVVGSYAYVADASAGLKIINIANPVAPVLTGSLNLGSTNAIGVTVVGNYAYVADDTAGLKIINVANPAVAVLVGNLGTSFAQKVMVVGNYAYVADYTSGLKIINIGNPAAPVLAGSLGTFCAHSVAVVGNYAYVADNAAGLKIINIANPAAPILVGSIATNCARNAIVVGNYAYVADDTAGLKIINIANPAAPVLVGSLGTTNAIGVAVAGNYAYVADLSAGLKIINIANPSDPVLAGSLGTYFAYGVAVVGNYAYVADASSGLKIIQVSGLRSIALTPGNPNIAEGTTQQFIATGSYIDNSPQNITNSLIWSSSNISVATINNPSNLGLATTLAAGITTITATLSSIVGAATLIVTKGPAVSVSDLSKSGLQNTVMSFVATDFISNFMEENGGNLAKIQIVTLPDYGTLKFSGNEVVVNQEILAESLGKLTFVPEVGWTGDTSFSWKGSNGMVYSINAANVNITITTTPTPPDVAGWVGWVVGTVSGAVSVCCTVVGVVMWCNNKCSKCPRKPSGTS